MLRTLDSFAIRPPGYCHLSLPLCRTSVSTHRNFPPTDGDDDFLTVSGSATFDRRRTRGIVPFRLLTCGQQSASSFLVAVRHALVSFRLAVISVVLVCQPFSSRRASSPETHPQLYGRIQCTAVPYYTSPKLVHCEIAVRFGEKRVVEKFLHDPGHRQPTGGRHPTSHTPRNPHPPETNRSLTHKHRRRAASTHSNAY